MPRIIVGGFQHDDAAPTFTLETISTVNLGAASPRWSFLRFFSPHCLPMCSRGRGDPAGHRSGPRLGERLRLQRGPVAVRVGGGHCERDQGLPDVYRVLIKNAIQA